MKLTPTLSKREIDALMEALNFLGTDADSMHGEATQRESERKLRIAIKLIDQLIDAAREKEQP